MLVFTFEPFEQVLELKQNKFTNYDYKDTLYAKTYYLTCNLILRQYIEKVVSNLLIKIAHCTATEDFLRSIRSMNSK